MSESALSLLSVGAVDFGSSVASTAGNGLCRQDVEAALGLIKDKRYRYALLMVSGHEHMVDFGLLYLSVLGALSLKSKKYLKLVNSQAKINKLEAVIGCAFKFLSGNAMSRDEKCFQIGVKKDSYHDNWQKVEHDVVAILEAWIFEGDSALRNQLLERRKSA